MIGSPASRGAVASVVGAGRDCLAAALAVSAASAAIAASVTMARPPQRRVARVDCAVMNRFTDAMSRCHGVEVAKKTIADVVRSSSVEQAKEFAAKVGGKASMQTFIDRQALWKIGGDMEMEVSALCPQPLADDVWARNASATCIGSRLQSGGYWLVLSWPTSGFGSSSEGGLAASGEADLDAILWPR